LSGHSPDLPALFFARVFLFVLVEQKEQVDVLPRF
jgi:hypothetical protein